MAFIVVLDANVLYPFHLRDLLVRIALKGLYQAKWTEAILDEAFDNLRANRPDLDPARLERTRRMMCEVVRDCLVTGYEPLVAGIETPDPQDRHVIAAAIRSQAQVIVTNDQTGFPSTTLEPYGIKVQTADEFVAHCIDLNPELVVDVLEEMSEPLKEPSMNSLELLELLERHGLDASAEAVRPYLWRRY